MSDCIFCINTQTNSSSMIGPDRFIKEYAHWWLFLQRADKLKSTKQAAGLLIAKMHTENVSDIGDEAAKELFTIIKDASQSLCSKVGTTYADQETIGFNQGSEAGQTILHAHVHVLPVSKEDPDKLKIRSGIGGAFEALRKERLNSKYII